VICYIGEGDMLHSTSISYNRRQYRTVGMEDMLHVASVSYSRRHYRTVGGDLIQWLTIWYIALIILKAE
jgi:hypothetical protein